MASLLDSAFNAIPRAEIKILPFGKEIVTVNGKKMTRKEACSNPETFIPFIPTIMREKGWGHAARLLNHWFRTPANSVAQHGIPNNSIITMNWVLSFPRAARVFNDAVRKKIWLTKAAQLKIKELIIREGALPLKIGQTKNFGNVGEHPQTAYEMERFNTSNQVQFALFHQSPIIAPIDELTAALGNFNFDFVVEGKVEKIKNDTHDKNLGSVFSVTINKVGVYVRDSFDFADNRYYSQPLGFWDGINDYVGKLNLPESQYVDNQSFRDWRTKYGKGFGGAFLVFSDIRVLNTNDEFSFKQ
jgi:hypothetical protein